MPGDSIHVTIWSEQRSGAVGCMSALVEGQREKERADKQLEVKQIYMKRQRASQR